MDWERLDDDAAARIAALAFQLPPDGRVWSAVSPATSHGTVAMLLRRIEHNQRIWHWANTKEAKDKGTAPEPIRLAGEEDAEARSVESMQRDADAVARLIGLSP